MVRVWTVRMRTAGFGLGRLGVELGRSGVGLGWFGVGLARLGRDRTVMGLG